ncbi:MAG: SusC/RagA family TonB-linked outer membrane protein [Paramuribaculum sp.]|nr:SusC/RagA family TonB-linked outer membrane protein [Paramuribaculum sp.]
MTNNNIKNWCLALALAAAAPAAFAANELEAPVAAAQQTADCTGVVLDSDGEPLPGASVKVVGTTNGGSTNIDGEFTLKGVAKGAKITVSYVGCKPQTVVWNGTPLTITLADDDNVLNEVVVMGYGVEQKRANVTNSIAKVSEKALTVGTNANPAQALVGAVSGVRVKVTSGSPSATPSITVRGGGNFDGGSNEPLIVVDGQIRSSLSDINPNDIADMQILKDAGATALYGARAGNGVVLITTKQGQAGTGKVSLSAKWGLNSYWDTGYDICSDEDFLYYFRTGKMNSQWALPGGGYPAQAAGLFTGTNGPGDTGRTTYSPTQNYNVLRKTADNAYLLEHKGWREMLDPLSDNYILYKPNNILDYNLNNIAVTQDYNLNFSGGNDRGNYYAALGYYDAQGAVKETFYTRYNFAFTGSYKINSWLTSNSVFNYTRANWLNDNPMQETAYMMNRGIFWKFLNFEDLDGTPMYGNNGPVNVNVNKGKFKRDYQSDKFQMTQSFTAKIIEGLTLKGTMSWFYNEQTTDWSNLEYAQNNTGADNMWNKTGETSGINRQYAVGNSFSRYFDQTYNLVANFSRTFNEKHNVNAMLGTEFYKRKYLAFDAEGNGAALEGYPDLVLTSQASREIDSQHLNEALMSYFGRVEYNYDQRYLIAATFREDGYSRLINNRWGFFPGVSAGWVMSNENFWKENSKLAFINYAKLRGSFGMNATINSSRLGYYTLRGSYTSWMYDGNTGYRMGSLPNPNLKWERTRTAELGLTLGFLQNRFNLDLTYYNRLTMDKYAAKSLPQTTGFSSITDNNGSYQNQGIEIDVNATLLRTRDFQWTLGANITYNSNKIVKLPYSGLENNRVINTGVEVYTGNGNETHYIAGYQEGQNPFQQVGHIVSHMVRNQADIDALGDYIDVYNGQKVYATEAGRQRLIGMGVDPSNMIRLMPGSFVYKDINGDNMIDNKDRGIIGHSDVKWSGGFNTTLSWKGLSLYARFDMGFDFQVYDSNLSFWLAEGQGAMAFPKQVRDTWTPSNPGAKYPRLVWADQYGSDSYVRTNSFFAQNGNYLACRELSLSYQLPDAICKKFRSQGLTLSVTGQNLGYIKSCTIPLPDNTTYWTGGTAGNGGTYNIPRTVIFGLNVSF